MFKRLKRGFKRSFIKAIRAREEQALFQVADMIRHEYPANTSLHEIVKHLKETK